MSEKTSSVRQIAEKLWKEFDLKKQGVLDKIEGFKLVNKVMQTFKGINKFDIGDFDQWFEKMDTAKAATLEKSLIFDYII